MRGSGFDPVVKFCENGPVYILFVYVEVKLTFKLVKQQPLRSRYSKIYLDSNFSEGIQYLSRQSKYFLYLKVRNPIVYIVYKACKDLKWKNTWTTWTADSIFRGFLGEHSICPSIFSSK